MTPERFQQIKAILADALELPPSAQHEFLLQACGEDQALLDETQLLLSIEIEPEFMQQSPLQAEFEEDVTPEQIGRIKITRLIASGGMGKVYEGIDELLKRPVAVKVMHSEQQLSKERRVAFRHEAQVLSSLQHPNICQIHDLFSSDGHDILVLEFIDGMTLKTALVNNLVQDPIHVAIKILQGLTAAHERGIAHRDLKPDNVMIDLSGAIKILDFGLAKSKTVHVASHSQAHSDQAVCSNKANDGKTQVSGTPGYMSPEQALGNTTNTATDMWSFGLILCQLLTGKNPMSSDASLPQLLLKTQQAEVTIPKKLPRAEKALVQLLLCKEPANRPSARQALNSLEQIKNRPKRRITIAITAALLLTSLIAGWKYTHDLSQYNQQLTEERELAEQSRQEAEDLVDFMLNDLYTGLRSVGRMDLLETTANKALTYFDSLNQQQMLQNDGQRAMALLQIAEVFGDRGNTQQAADILAEAIKILESAHQQQKNNELISYRLAWAYLSSADVLKLLGGSDLAKQHAYQATLLGQKLTQGLAPGSGPATEPTGIDRWRILLRGLYLHADGHMRMGEREEAIKLLERVVVLAEPAAEKSPELLINLSDIQFKRCGTFYDANLLDRVLEPCLAYFKIDQALLKNDPKNYQLTKNLVGDHSALANTYRRLGDLESGLKIAIDGIALGKKLIQWDPDNSNTKNEYVTVLLALGSIQLEMGAIEQGRKTFTQAYEIIAPLASDQEEISYLNSTFIALVHLDRIEEARKVAVTLQSRGFMRRDYQDLCVEYNIQECQVPKQ